MSECRTCGTPMSIIERWNTETTCGKSMDLVRICPLCSAVPRSQHHVSRPAGRGEIVIPEAEAAFFRDVSMQIGECS
jgi:hypothetical protein